MNTDPDLAKIQAIFPGAEIAPTQPSARICILNDIRVAEVGFDQIAELYKIDPEGIPTDVDNPIDSRPAPGENFRTYMCVNCGYACPGEEEFETMRQHLGKRNPFLHPFGESL